MKIPQKNIEPKTQHDLINDFERIGIKNGTNLMVHSSLSKIGWVIGGSQTVIRALFNVVGKNGTIVMPSATPFCLHPKDWEGLNIPENWILKIVEHLPVFEVETTPTSMGVLSETFRNWPNTFRSNHPISSVCANGKLATEIIKKHKLEISEGVETPYEKVYDLDFKILLLGVGFNRCTMLHFAESKSKNRRLTKSCYPVLKDDERVWLEVTDMGNDNGAHFPRIGELYLKNNISTVSKIGEADSILISTKSLVDFGTEYFNNK